MAKAKKKAKKAAGPQLVMGTRVKDYIKSKATKNAKVQCAGDLVDALNVEVAALLDKAVKRSKDNGRATVQPRDL